MKHVWARSFIIVAIAHGAIGCTQSEKGTTSLDGRISPTYAGPSERTYCGGNLRTFPSTPIAPNTIDGTATYDVRKPFYTSAYGFSQGLGPTEAGGNIRYAEVRITNQFGVEVQCTETNGSGAYTFTLPNDGATYTISIFARGDNDFVKASVLNKPEENAIYSISQTFVSDGDKTLPVMNAEADNTIVGAAFNILDRLVDANNFLRTQVGSCSTLVDGCTDFDVAPKVAAYWEKGYNPNAYFGAASSPVSFYLPSYSRLFILGGINGNTDTSDTDHFDNSIILHEYGHFLEDIYSDTDSKGGSHSANKLIDPRLAWSEGWGNFIQAAVLNESIPRYTDTKGNVDGSTTLIFKINVENGATSCTYVPPDTSNSVQSSGCDLPVFSGEGQFREFAVTRFLWDTFDDESNIFADSDGVTNGFPEVWAILTGSNMFKKSTNAFRDIGLLHYYQQTLTQGGGAAPITDWSALRTIASGANKRHLQPSDRSEYAQYVLADNSCATMSYDIDPYYDLADSGSFTTSHWLRNNNFYWIKHAGGVLKLTLNYATSSGTEADLDLYLYDEDARFGNSADIVASSARDPSNATVGGVETETLTANVAAGNYLVNVMVYTGGNVGDDTDYEIYYNNSTSGLGSRLCPANVP